MYGERLANVRSHFAMSQAEFSNRAGVSLRAYQNYERGEREISVDLLKAMYLEFGVSPVWVITGEGEMLATEKPSVSLDREILAYVVEAVINFEASMNKIFTAEYKTRLISLLYEQAILVTEVKDKKVGLDQVQTILKSIA